MSFAYEAKRLWRFALCNKRHLWRRGDARHVDLARSKRSLKLASISEAAALKGAIAARYSAVIGATALALSVGPSTKPFILVTSRLTAIRANHEPMM